MRTIKFRAWDRTNKRFWSHFSVSSAHGSIWFRGLKKEDWELMQFTGLIDKNGKEIYEGDIVKGNRVGIIIYSDEHAGFYTFFKRRDLIDNIFPEYLEVIGNIYENPELLSE